MKLERWQDARVEGQYLVYATARRQVRRIPLPHPPALYVRQSDLPVVDSVIPEVNGSIVEDESITIALDPAVRLEFRTLDDRQKFKDQCLVRGIEVYNSLDYVKQLMIEHEIRQTPPEKIAYLDIEVEAVEKFPSIYQASQRILSIAIVGNEKVFISEDDEVSMLKQTMDILRREYDVVTGWNWRHFDKPYLENRARTLGLPWDIFPCQDFDLLFAYQRARTLMKVGGTGTTKLEQVVKELLGVDHRSMHTTEDFKRLYESFMGDKQLLRDYNMADATLTRELDLRYEFSAPYLTIACSYPGIMIRDMTSMSEVWDTLLLWQSIQRRPRVVYPRKTKKRDTLVGAGLLHRTGVYRNCVLLDFKALYPSIIQTFQLSPETVAMFESVHGRLTLGKLGDYVRFVRGYAPVLAKMMGEFLTYRQKAKQQGKKSVEYGYKLLQTSAYGAIGVKTGEKRQYYRARFPNASFYNIITSVGRSLLHLLSEEVKARGYTPIHGDTDSIIFSCPLPLLQLTAEVERIADDLNRWLRDRLFERFPLDPDSYVLSLEPRAVYEWVLTSPAKKKWRGEAVWVEGEYKRETHLIGFEVKRTDAFPLMKFVQDRVQQILAKESPDRVQSEIDRLLARVQKALRSGMLDRELVIEANVRKGDLDSYDRDDPHIRAAKKLKERGFVEVGNIRWVVTRWTKKERVEEPIPPGSDEIPRIESSGYDYYIDRIKRMVSKLTGWKVGSPSVQTKLDQVYNG